APVFRIGGKRSTQVKIFAFPTLAKKTQVPRVFIGEKCVGGGSDVEALHRSGKLKGMLESIGALQ
ncbi:hypothetical protein XENOCAPTIV_030335, partial [Xenoophorus captivus]